MMPMIRRLDQVLIDSDGASWFSMKPIKVPAGSRLSARYRTSTGAADSVDLYIFTLSGF